MVKKNPKENKKQNKPQNPIMHYKMHVLFDKILHPYFQNGFQKKKKKEYVIKCQMLSIVCMFWQIFLNIFEVNVCAQLTICMTLSKINP